MKKVFLGALITVFTLSFYSCRETTENTETTIEEVDANLEEAGQELENQMEEVGDEIDQAAEEVDEEVDVNVNVDEQ